MYALYHAVIKHGGVENVIARKGWRDIAEELELPPSCTDSGYRLKLHYCNFLYPYERRYFLRLDDEIPPDLMVRPHAALPVVGFPANRVLFWLAASEGQQTVGVGTFAVRRTQATPGL